MKILYISHSNALDGSNIALLNIIKGITAHGHEAYVVTAAEEGPFLQELDKMKVKYDRINITMTIYSMNKNPILYLPRIAYMLYRRHCGIKAVVKIIKTFKPDIVHTNVGPIDVGFEASRKTCTPHVWHQREYMDKIGVKYFPSFAHFSKQTHSTKNYNVCITEGVFNHWNFDKNKDVVIYDGVFGNNFAQLFIPERKPENIVLFVGRVEENKGVMELITAFDSFHKAHPEYKLNIVGDTPTDSIGYDIKCKQYVKTHYLQESILFLGRQSNIYEYMSKSRMLIMSSQFEGFGFVTAEAMACGCPVIGKDTTGTKEQMDNGLRLTGDNIGIRYSTIEELTAAMHMVATTDTTDMCDRARKTVFSLYTTEENVKHIENYYKNILNQS